MLERLAYPGITYWICIAAGVCGLLLTVRSLLSFRRKRRHRGTSTALIDAGLAASLLSALALLPELGFVAFIDRTDSFSNTNLSQRWSSLHVKTNRDHFRDELELPHSRQPGKTFVLFVGDSFTFGHGIEEVRDRFSDRIRERVESRFPGRFILSNVALPGLDIRQLVDGLLPELAKNGVPVDHLVYTFVPNDIEYLEPRTAEFYQQAAARNPSFFLWKHTWFYNWLYFRTLSLGSARGSTYYDYLAQSYEGEPWNRFSAKLDDLRKFCDKRNIKLHLVIFPFLHSLGPDDPFLSASRRMNGYCQQHSVPYLDLRPILEPHRMEGLTVNRFDAHPNIRAHKLAAEAIYEQLLSGIFKH